MTNAARTSEGRSESPGSMLQYGVMAAFMESGRALDKASSLLLIAGLLAGLPAAVSGWPAILCVSINLGLAMIAKYYGWRVALDAELFRLLAQYPGQAGEFDHALSYCLGRQANGTHSHESRWQGARRLLVLQAVLVVLQAGAVAASVMANIFFQ